MMQSMRAGWVALALLWPSPLNARARFAGAVGGGSVDGASGVSMDIGGTFLWRWMQASATGSTLFYDGAGSDRYYLDDLSSGQTRCRDGDTGQFASDSKCSSTSVAASGLLDAAYLHRLADGKTVAFGGGYRASSDGSGPYGVVGVSFPLHDLNFVPNWYIRGHAGPDFFLLSVGVLLGGRAAATPSAPTQPGAIKGSGDKSE